MPVAEKSKEAQLKDQLSDVKAALSAAENRNNLLSRDLAAARKQAAKADDLEARVAALEATVQDRDREIGRLKADVATASAAAERAQVILDAVRSFKRVLDAA